VINNEKTDLHYVNIPTWKDLGEMGAIFNMIGSLLFNVNTMLMFDASSHDSVWFEYNLVYVLSGGGGSIFFALGAIAEGEHNGWRECSKETWKRPEIQVRQNEE